MKSQGTGSLLTIAPELRSLWPRMLNSPSCSAVRRLCWLSILSTLISSMNSTPLLALCIAPGSSRSCAGVSSPPLWNGSCLTSPSNAPACEPVASMNEGISSGVCDISSFGTISASRRWPLMYLKIMNMNSAPMMPIRSSVASLYMMNIMTDSIRNMKTIMIVHWFRWLRFCSASAFCAWTISLPFPAGTIRTLGSFESSGL